jgi:hypothetical protein
MPIALGTGGGCLISGLIFGAAVVSKAIGNFSWVIVLYAFFHKSPTTVDVVGTCNYVDYLRLCGFKGSGFRGSRF